MNERRRKLVPVSGFFVHERVPHTGDVVHSKCVEGLPADATFIGLTYDHLRDVYYFCYQSAEWEETPDGMALPMFNPRFINLHVAPFLEQAERLIEHYAGGSEYGDKWLEEYCAFKEQTGYPSHTMPPSIDPDNALAEDQKGEFTETEPW